MWSKKGRPVWTSPCPLPSKSSSTFTTVSPVSRDTMDDLPMDHLLDSRHEGIGVLRPAHTDADRVPEPGGVKIAHKHPLLSKPLPQVFCPAAYHPAQDEVGPGGAGAHIDESGKLKEEPLPFLQYGLHPPPQVFQVLQRCQGGHLGGGIDIVWG